MAAPTYPNTWNVIEAAGVICEPERPPFCLDPDYATGLTELQYLGGGFCFVVAFLFVSFVNARFNIVDFPEPIRAVTRLVALSPLQDVIVSGVSFLTAILFWYSYANNRMDFLSVYMDFFVAVFALLQDMLRFNIRGRAELYNLTLPRMALNLVHSSFQAEYAFRGLMRLGVLEPRFWHVGFLGWGRIALILREYLYRKSLKKGNVSDSPTVIFLKEALQLLLWLCCAGQMFALLELMGTKSSIDRHSMGLLSSAYVLAMAMLRVGTANVELTQAGKLIVTIVVMSSTYSFAKLFTVLYTETMSRQKFDVRPLPPFRLTTRPLLLVTGYPEPDTVAEFLLVLFRGDAAIKTWDVLVLVPREPLFFHKVRDLVRSSNLTNEIFSRTYFQHGSPVVDATSLHYECVVILPSFTNEHDTDDADIAVLALALHDRTSRLLVAGKGLDERVLHLAGKGKRPEVGEALSSTAAVSWPLFRFDEFALAPSGASAFVGNLIEGSHAADNEFAGRHGWSFEYEAGLKSGLKVQFLPADIYGDRDFQEIALDFLDRSKGKAVLLGFLENGDVMVNPRRNFRVDAQKGVHAVFLGASDYAITVRRDGLWSSSLQAERGANADAILDAEDEELGVEQCLPEFPETEKLNKRRSEGERENEAENAVWKKALQEGRILGARKVLLTGKVGVDVLAQATGISEERLTGASDAGGAADDVDSEEEDDDTDELGLDEMDETELFRQRRKAVKRDVFEALVTLRPVSDDVLIPAGEDFPAYAVVCSVSSRPVEYKLLSLLARRLDCNLIVLNQAGIHFRPSDKPDDEKKRVWHMRGHPSNERDLKQLGLVRAKAIFVMGDPGSVTGDTAVAVTTRLMEQRLWKLSATANVPIISELAADPDLHILIPMRPRVGEPGLPFLEAIAAPDGLDLVQSGRWACGHLVATRRSFLASLAKSVTEPHILPVVTALMRSPVRLMLVPDRWFGKTLGRYMRWLLVHRRLVAVALVRNSSYTLEPEAHLREFTLKTVVGSTPVRHRIVVSHPSWELALQPGDYFICYREAIDPKKLFELVTPKETPMAPKTGRRHALLAI